MLYSLLEGVAFEESGVVLVVVVLLLLGPEYRSGTFLFLSFFLFFGCVHPYCH
jgi:hypothetical protein